MMSTNSKMKVHSKTQYYFYGADLRAARIEAGLLQKQLVNRLIQVKCPRPISNRVWLQQTVSNLERTKIAHAITPEQIKAFNRALDPDDDLMD